MPPGGLVVALFGCELAGEREHQGVHAPVPLRAEQVDGSLGQRPCCPWLTRDELDDREVEEDACLARPVIDCLDAGQCRPNRLPAAVAVSGRGLGESPVGEGQRGRAPVADLLAQAQRLGEVAERFRAAEVALDSAQVVQRERESCGVVEGSEGLDRGAHRDQRSSRP